jgi:hypothetical protein
MPPYYGRAIGQPIFSSIESTARFDARAAHASTSGSGHAWRNDSDPHDIVPGGRHGVGRRGRKILVGEKTQNQAALGNTFSEFNVSQA